MLTLVGSESYSVQVFAGCPDAVWVVPFIINSSLIRPAYSPYRSRYILSVALFREINYLEYARII